MFANALSHESKKIAARLRERIACYLRVVLNVVITVDTVAQWKEIGH